MSFEWGEYLKRSKDAERDGAVLMGWNADYIDPHNFLAIMVTCAYVGGSNRANWCDEDYDALVSAAGATFDIEERTRL